MKRVNAIKMLLGGDTTRVAIQIGYCEYEAGELIQLYDYLDEDLPEASPTCCQPGSAVEVWEDPESDQKEPEKVQKEAKPVRKRIDIGKVVALYKAGWKQKDIAKEIGCYESTISTCLKKARAEGKV